MFNIPVLSGKAKGAVGAWTPAQLTGLIAWYKADAGVYSDAGITLATNTSLVQQWNDQSGHGYHLLQPTSGNRPTYLSGGLNSKPTIHNIIGSTTGMLTASGVAIGTGTTGSIFLMGTVTTSSTANARSVVYSPPAGSDSVSGAMYMGRNSQAIFGTKGTNSNFGTSQAVTYTTVTRMGIVNDGSNVNTYVNNVAGTQAAAVDSFISGGYIGIGRNTSSAGTQSTIVWDGLFSEIIITNTAMSTTDRSSLDAYLVARWS